MRALVQRVRSASVEVSGQTMASIESGLLVFIGVRVGDTEREAEALASKLLGLRIFEDSAGKMNLSVGDAKGSFLVVSQFTLYADTEKGRRPSFQRCAPAGISKPLYEGFLDHLRLSGASVEEGVFGAHMIVRLENDGPVTFNLEVENPQRA